MIGTRVGYAGGRSAAPTYHQMGDHTEVVRLTFNPEQIPLEALLELFWEYHRPVKEPYSRQYMSLVVCADEGQLALVEKKKAEISQRIGAPLQTEISLKKPFYSAEDYHQKWRLQHSDVLMAELRDKYSDFSALVDSPTAARLNAYVAGHLSGEQLQREISLFGLSHQGQEFLTRKVG